MGLLVELQWHVNQNKIAVGFLEITFILLVKVISLLGEKSVFSAITSKPLKSSLFDIFRARLELKSLSPYQSKGSQAHVCKQVFKTFHVCLGLHIVVMITGIHISQGIFAIDMLTALKSCLEQDRNHFVQLSRLYGNQA